MKELSVPLCSVSSLNTLEQDSRETWVPDSILPFLSVKWGQQQQWLLHRGCRVNVNGGGHPVNVGPGSKNQTWPSGQIYAYFLFSETELLCLKHQLSTRPCAESLALSFSISPPTQPKWV